MSLPSLILHVELLKNTDSSRKPFDFHNLSSMQVVDAIANAVQPPLSGVKPQVDTVSTAGVRGSQLANENQVGIPCNGQEEAEHELGRQQEQQEAPASLLKAVAVTVDAPHQQQPNNLSGEAREKLVMVPTRKRTVRGGGGSEPLSSQDPNVIDPSGTANAINDAGGGGGGGGGGSFRRFELPATPFGHPPPDTDEKLYGPNPTPGGLPATTPIAAEVLASLNLAAAAAGFAFPPPSQYPLSAQQQQQEQEQQLYNSYQQRQAMYGYPSYAHGNAPLHKMNLATNHVGTERMPCKCKRSQCLKLYCDCFAAGGFCMPGCICAGCRNTIKYTRMVQNARKIVLAKDPHAFQIKIGNEGHKKGCRCKRSRCLKKYCECFLAGSKCNPETCTCEGCLNMEFPRDEPDAPDVADTWTIPAVGGLGESSGAAGMVAGMVAAGMQQQAAAMFAADHQVQYAAAAAAAAANASTPPIPMFDPMLLSTLMAGLPVNGVGSSKAALYNNPPEGVTLPLPQMYHTMAAAFRAAAAECQDMPAEVAMAKGMPALSSFMMNQGQGGQKQQLERGEHQEQQEQQQLQQLPFALVSHPSEAANQQRTAGPETADTATSPASNAADIEAAIKKRQLDYISETLTGGSKAAAGNAAATARPPLPYSNSMVMMMANKALLSHQAAAAGGVSLSAGTAVVPEERSKRPKRAASGGVMGAVAAETSDWGLDLVSPPLRKTTSLPPPPPGAGHAAGGRASKQQPHERVALLKDALHRETARSLQEHKNIAAAAVEAGNSGEEDEADAVSALFELCSSQF